MRHLYLIIALSGLMFGSAIKPVVVLAAERNQSVSAEIEELERIFNQMLAGSHIEQVIILGERALEIIPGIKVWPERIAYPFNVTTVQIEPRLEVTGIIYRKLGYAFFNRSRGSRRSNIELAIKYNEASNLIFIYENAPALWAATQLMLGQNYLSRLSGNRTRNVEFAISYFEKVLSAAAQNPSNVANEVSLSAHYYLGSAYMTRENGNRAHNVDLAIKHYEVGTQGLETHFALGRLYLDRVSGMRSENEEKSRIYFDKVIAEGRNRDSFFLGFSRIASIATVHMMRNNWTSASVLFIGARLEFISWVDSNSEDSEDGSPHIVAQSDSLLLNAAYTFVEMNDLASALRYANDARSILLRKALRQAVLELTLEQRVKLVGLRSEIKQLLEIETDHSGEKRVEVFSQLSEKRGELNKLVASGLRNSDESILATAGRLVPPSGAIVVPIVTSIGSKVLIVTRQDGNPKISVINLPNLTKARLVELFGNPRLKLQELYEVGPVHWNAKKYFDAMNLQYVVGDHFSNRIGEWHDAIGSVGVDLWAVIGGAIDSGLKEAGLKDGAHVILLPTGSLGLLPLGLAHESTTGRRFGDRYEVTVAPNLEALASASKVIAAKKNLSLTIIVNPRGDLRFSDMGAQFIQTLFKEYSGRSPIRIDQNNADRSVMLAALENKAYWHFSTHGFYNWQEPRQSGLQGRDEENDLTIGNLLDRESVIGKPRLVVLSACESGLYDLERNAEEFFGLPAAFMQAGAAGVVSALWQVDEWASVFLFMKFYQLQLEQGLEPPTALKQAQAWLRTATKSDLIAFGKAAAAKARSADYAATIEATLKAALPGENNNCFAATARLDQTPAPAPQVLYDMSVRPFKHPYCWGGFVYMGL